MHVPLLASITGLPAGWLIGAGVAACAPVLAHLLRRRPRRTIVLPTARFLARLERESARGRRLRERLTLACRCLALLLLGLAFATPEWANAARAAPAGERTVFVLDASASMRRTEDGRSLFDRAHDLIEKELRENPARESGVVVARRSPAALLPRLTTNTLALLDALGSTGPTHEHASLREAMALAASLPDATGRASPRRIVLVTDAARDAFEGVAAGEFLGAEIVRVARDPAPTNRAVLAPSISPARPVEGSELTLAFTLANHNPDPASVPVSIRTPGGLRTQTIDIDAWSTRAVDIPLAAPPAGVHTFELSIPSDRTPADDTARIVAVIDTAHRASVLTREGSTLLAPLLASVEHATPASTDTIGGAGALIVADPGPLPDAALETIAARMRDGLAVLWIANNADASDLLGRLLPLEPGAPLFASIDRLGTPDEARLADPERIFGRRVHPSLDAALRSVRFSTRFEIVPTAAADVAANFSDGSPLLFRIPYGHGSLTVFAADIGLDSTPLLRTPLFPLLMNAIAGSPDASTSRGALVMGAPSGLEQLSDPPAEPSAALVRDDAGRAIDGRAWNIDPREADPRPIDASAEEALFSGVSSVSADPAGTTIERVTPLWPFLALASLVALAIESLLVASRTRRTRASETPELLPTEAAA